jgi:EAL domain-containing protein (putative c-di-GMP-specific phosphodiesterase class I)
MGERAVLPTWFLEGFLGEGRSLIIPVTPLPFLVGRRENCDLKLSARNISREHAVLFLKGNRLWVRDLGSRNGTFVNRELVIKETPLSPGESLHFGDLEFRVGRRESDGPLDETGETATALPSLASLLQAYETDLRGMLSQRVVESYFQPIMGLKDMKLFGYEITSRGRYGNLPTTPGDLFSIAEGLHCAADLSRLFWQEGLSQSARLPGRQHLFINIHPDETGQPDLVKALQDVRLTTPRLEITVEISEKAVTDLDLMRSLKQQLTDLDIRLAYDDFGAGQARFRELIEVPPHFLKFDQSLIQEIDRMPERFHKVVETLVRMAKELDIATVAEGVESPGESRTCAQMGFDFAQGYLFGKPARVGDLAEASRRDA